MVSVDIGLVKAAAFSDCRCCILRILRMQLGDVRHQTSQTLSKGNGRFDLRPLKSHSI
jgi:hypothetical protein